MSARIALGERLLNLIRDADERFDAVTLLSRSIELNIVDISRMTTKQVNDHLRRYAKAGKLRLIKPGKRGAFGTMPVYQLEWEDRSGPVLSTKEHSMAAGDAVSRPRHYNSHPSNVECIQIVEHMGFCIGNAIKYLWRAGLKPGTDAIEDLKKAQWYIDREIQRLEKGGTQ